MGRYRNLIKAKITMLKDSNRKILIDQQFSEDVENKKYINHLFTRLVAKKISFKEVDFRYCIFESSYLRSCTFDSCNFTGCRFIDSNLSGSGFTGCNFDYTSFERTQIDDDILDNGGPSTENLRLKFARSLRVNYQQMGDAKSANKAIGIELQATENHLKKAWSSKESYYSKKYKGLKRIKPFLEWLEFKLLDLIWGNGESALKLIRFSIVIMLIITFVDVFKFGNPDQFSSYVNVFLKSPQILLGVELPNYKETWYVTTILFIRLVLFGFFMSIIIKRFNKR